MSSNVLPIIFFGSFILLLIAAIVSLVFPKLNPFKMTGGGCGCNNNTFLIWGTVLLGGVVLLYVFNTKIM